MRVLLVALFVSCLVLSCKDEPKMDMKDEVTRVNYAIGLSIGNFYKESKVEWRPEIIAKGFQDAATGASALMTEDEIREIMQNLNREMSMKHQQKMQELALKNKAQADSFLVANKTKPGVITTASGLQYKIVTPGSGPSPKLTDVVSVHYIGRLLNGEEFDSSYKHNTPATFQLNGVIMGWQEALQLMKPGAKYELFIPAELGYGPRGSGQKIGPNAALIFDVELLQINPAAK